MKVIFILNNIRSLYNVGSIFRSADCFGVDELILSGYTGKPPDNKIEKVALGATESVKWRYFSSLGNALKKLRLENPDALFLGLENGDLAGFKQVYLDEYDDSRGLVVLLGEEVKGINKRYYSSLDGFLTIRQYGLKESLNVSVAASIAMYQLKAVSESAG